MAQFPTTKCQISRAEFSERAKTAKVTLEYEGKSYVFEVEPTTYKTGSMGWPLNEKCVFTLDGRDVKMQVGLNITCVGSKELPPLEVATPAAA